MCMPMAWSLIGFYYGYHKFGNSRHDIYIFIGYRPNELLFFVQLMDVFIIGWGMMEKYLAFQLVGRAIYKRMNFIL